MIKEFLIMNGYGFFVWSAFVFTIFSFLTLYYVIKSQFVREKNKFILKFGTLDSERAELAKSQSINKEILSNITSI
tara:strand:+ start:60 stop:287 length:228 start_codon:yes stop_codon:yes gene_type:complete